MKRLNLINSVILGCIILLTVGCKKDEEANPVPGAPDTYAFERNGATSVSYSGQTERLDMLEILTNTMKNGNTVGTEVNAQDLKNMFRNEGDAFAPLSFGKDLFSKCYSGDTDMIEGWMDELAANSSATESATPGTAGVVLETGSTTDGYLVNDHGIELTQVISKTLMGSVFFYQAMESYLTSERMGTVGNDEVEDGANHTEMEHYFDEAFGYFGAPTDFPSAVTIDNARFWAKYCDRRNGDSQPGINNALMDAFINGRHAIVNTTYDDRDAAIATVAEKWGIVIAATAKDYLSSALSTTGIAAHSKHHALSEAIGFMHSLKYHFANGNSKVSPLYNYSSVEQALTFVGMSTDFYTLTDTEIQSAIDNLDQAFPNVSL
jgi:hypothetical protein